MTDVIIIAIVAALILVAVRSMMQKKGGCCSSGNDVKIKVKDKNAANYPYQAVVKVNGMTCSKCKVRVENAFNEEGMWAEVNLKDATAVVRMKEKITEERIEILLKRFGYEAVNVYWK